MIYTTTISDAAIPGIEAARAAYNSTQPDTIEQGEGDSKVTVPNPALKTDNSAYIDFVLKGAFESWNIQHAAVITPVVSPPVDVNGVPQSVTMRQAQIALSRAGLLDSVNAAIAGMPGEAGIEARITWGKSSVVLRSASLIAGLAGAMNLSSAQVDTLFVTAAAIPA